MATTGKKKFTNHLANEKSPYLLQHANNPVNWYPWGKEAFEKAREEKKLIFLSVGYSTCHWCHVMEHESFENEEIGDILNKHFISIKVDREERPDVDKVYMMFVQATTGSGGWPMSVWLTPDLEPVVGGTYFPPDDQSYGRPGFKTVLRKIAGKWQADSAQMVSQGSMILGVLKESLQKEVRLDQQEMPGKDVVDLCYSVLHNTFDKKLGGFGTAPKFPSPVNLNFLFRFFNAQPNCQKGQEALHMGLHTLRMMANGGMYDHVAQGFHRYSTDNFWHVPHFEKMLYDQAQLVISYLNAYQITKDEFFADVAKNVLEYVSRDLADPSGGFYSAEDADSYPTFHDEKKREGAFCVWTHDEVETLLNQSVSGIKMADLFCEHYCVQSSGNVDSYQDPHGELKNQNVLIVKGSIEKTAKCFCLSSEATKSILHDAIKILFEERKKRPRPDLDNKMIAAYNGMMMSGFAQAGQVLGDALFTGKAESIAQFLHTHLYQPEAGKLLRSCYLDDKQNVTQTSIPIEGFVDDYAFVIRGLLDLYEATFDEQWLKWANQLQHTQNELFLDTKIGGYFSTADTDPSIVLRIKDDQDGSEPSANSVSAFNLLKLAELGQSEWRNQVSIIMKVFQERLTKQPFAVPELTSAFLTFQQASKQIIIAGEKGNPEVDSLLQCIHSFFIPNKLLLLADGNEDGYLYKKLPQLKNMQKKEGLPTAFICENFTCSLPVTSISKLEKLLKESTVPNLFST